MFFEHIYDKTLAQRSFLIGCQATGEAIVIDARRDIDVYLEIAAQNNLRITHITETHIHADFLCGSRELAAVTGAMLYLSAEGGPDWLYEFPHISLKDGDIIRVGNLSLKVIHTPGHTPESISFLLTDHPATDQPVMIFTGDFVFTGDIGRPDLLEKAAGMIGTKEVGAHQMFQSLKKFSSLPDYVQVWSAHGAGSACGKALGAVAVSTVGYEKIRNWAFEFGDDEEAFVESLLADQPEPPKYFAQMKRLNKVKRRLLIEVPKHPQLSADQFHGAFKKAIRVVDTRHKNKVAQGFIPGSINIQGNNAFANWAGWLLNYEEQFMLVAEPEQMEDLTRKLMRIGLDNIYGFVSDVDGLGIELEKMNNITRAQLISMRELQDIQILDVRGLKEYQAGHIDGAAHVFLGTMEDQLGRISRSKPIIVYCQAGDRSSIAYSLLVRHGFKNIMNYADGYADWIKEDESSLNLAGVRQN